MIRSTQTPFYPALTAPGADVNDYVLFDSTTVGNTNNGALRRTGIRRMIIDIAHNADGTLNEFKSQDRGATWTQISAEAITAAANTSTFREYDITPYEDWKLEWENGGSAQTTWVVDVAGDIEPF